MLSELYIENLAVIEKVSIKFEQGFNVFTGETGAGKSIVIDAINAVLGQRTSKEIVRHGKEKASVIARFTGVSDAICDKLSELSYSPEDKEVIISREVSADGKSTAKLMGKPITVGMLKEIGALLINIHGQHDNQILLAEDKHIDILDLYGELENVKQEYFECYKNVVAIKRDIKRLSTSEDEKARKIDLLTYQIEEIEGAIFTEQEQEKLTARRQEIRNFQKINRALAGCYNALKGNDGEGGAVELMRSASSSIGDISDVFPPAEELSVKAEELFYEMQELASDVSAQLDELNISEDEQENVEARLEEIANLRRKYGDSADEVATFLENAQNELAEIKLSDERLLQLDKEGTAEFKRLLSLAQGLTKAREQAAERFMAAVSAELVFLDMPNVKLSVKREQVKPNAKGQDIIEFLISTNVGEPPKSIAKIASGGELSRIMLAIKNSLASKDDVGTLIFDEIDTGVSGRAAQKIGLKLHQAGQARQVISVTHSAQIAALGDNHFLIKKEVSGDSTYTTVHPLDLDGRVHEVARIMSTDKITDLMLKNAREMIVDNRQNV